MNNVNQFVNSSKDSHYPVSLSAVCELQIENEEENMKERDQWRKGKDLIDEAKKILYHGDMDHTMPAAIWSNPH